MYKPLQTNHMSWPCAKHNWWLLVDHLCYRLMMVLDWGLRIVFPKLLVVNAYHQIFLFWTFVKIVSLHHFLPVLQIFCVFVAASGPCLTCLTCLAFSFVFGASFVLKPPRRRCECRRRPGAPRARPRRICGGPCGSWWRSRGVPGKGSVGLVGLVGVVKWGMMDVHNVVISVVNHSFFKIRVQCVLMCQSKDCHGALPTFLTSFKVSKRTWESLPIDLSLSDTKARSLRSAIPHAKASTHCGHHRGEACGGGAGGEGKELIRGYNSERIKPTWWTVKDR